MNYTVWHLHCPQYGPCTNPTNDTTHDPAMDLTYDPTIDPTHDPAMDPTYDPTIDSTHDPTIDLTYDPTIDPTRDPTNNAGTNSTKDTINEHFHVPTLTDLAIWATKQCQICKNDPSKDKKQKALPELRAIQMPKSKFREISLDFMGPFNQTNRGNECILLAVDGLTRIQKQ